MSRNNAEIADDCGAIVAAMIAATGLSRAEFVRRMDAYDRRFGDDPEGARLFATEMEKLAEVRRRS